MSRSGVFQRTTLQRFFSDASGATAIEYGLIAGFIAIAIIVSLNSLGHGLNTTFTTVNNAFPTK